MEKNRLEPLLIVPDSHIPYESKKAFDLMLKVARDFRPHHLVVLGDFGDFYAVSQHSKNPLRARQLPEEIMACNRRLDQLDGLGATNKLFIEGNHEDRLRRYLQDKAPELFGIVAVDKLFQLKTRNWKYVPYKKYAKIGKLYLTHDVGVSGRNSTFKALDTVQHSVAVGHAHRLQYIVEGNAVGEFKLGCQFGWLGDKDQVEYLSQAKINTDTALGFGVGYVDSRTGIAYLQPVPIINYTCVVNGKLYV